VKEVGKENASDCCDAMGLVSGIHLMNRGSVRNSSESNRCLSSVLLNGLDLIQYGNRVKWAMSLCCTLSFEIK